MRIHLIRHAQSEANALSRVSAEAAASAPVDCALSELGVRQAKALAEHIAHLGLDLVLSSPYLRTLQTAEPIRARCRVPGRILPLLHEHHLLALPVEWPLMRREKLHQMFPHFEIPGDYQDTAWFHPPEYEDQALERGRQVLQWLQREFADRSDVRLAIVTHGSPVGKILLAFLDVPTSEPVRVTIDNASLTTLEIHPPLRWVHAVNRVVHVNEV